MKGLSGTHSVGHRSFQILDSVKPNGEFPTMLAESMPRILIKLFEGEIKQYSLHACVSRLRHVL